MKDKKYLMLLIIFVIFIGAAVACYNYLSDNYTAENSPQEGTDSSKTKDNAATDTDGGSAADSNKDSDTASKEPEEVKAVDFQVQDVSGKTVKLSDYYGKPIVINFWATWCGPCKSELPAFESLYKEYGEDVQFLMVNMTDGSRETVDGVKEFLDENGYEFPVYYDTESIAAYVYGAYSIPLSVFIDSEQNVVGYQVGAMEEDVIRSYIESIKGGTVYE